MDSERLTLEVVEPLVLSRDWKGLEQLAAERPYAEMAELFDDLAAANRQEALRNIDGELAVGIFDCLSAEQQIEDLQAFRAPRAARFLSEMSPDERADIFPNLPPALARRLIGLLTEEKKQDIRQLTRYDENTAGGIMTTEFVRVTPAMTVAQALEVFRKEYVTVEMVYYFYVLDNEGRLKGVVSLRQLASSPGETPLRALMHTRVYSVSPDTDQEEVAEELSLYDFYALPVTDERGRMLGIVTFDDVMDVIGAEAIEDQSMFSGLTPVSEEKPMLTVREQVWQRLPWLMGFLLLASLSGYLLDAFMGVFEHRENGLLFFGILLSLQPMLMATAGNAGTQSVTLSIQAIASGQRDWSHWRHVMFREAWLGLMIGAVLAVVAFGRAIVTLKHSLWHALFLGVSVSVAVVVCVTLSTCLGGFLPMLFKRLGFDPAAISSPFITSLMDVLSVGLYFLLALWLLPYFV